MISLKKDDGRGPVEGSRISFTVRVEWQEGHGDLVSSGLPPPSGCDMQNLNTVILAAGRSSRFGGDGPKCLAEVRGKPLLMHSLEALATAGIQNCTIVVGPHHKAITQWVLQSVLPLCPTIVRNERSDNWSMHSFQSAGTAIMDGCLLIESDLIYDHRIITTLLSCPDRNAICATPPRNRKPFFVRAGSDGTVTDWGYGLNTGRELVGIYKLSSPFVAKMMSFHDMEYWDPMLKLDEPIGCCLCDYPWNEIDTIEELADARAAWELQGS